jgi:AcrR family transcriptional regulator
MYAKMSLPHKIFWSFSRKKAMTFGKIGRPPEDRFARKCEIFKRVAPLILTVGARRLSMRQAARAACLSIGGLYHYFPTKHELVLYGIQPETLNQSCRNFHDSYGYLAAEDPLQYLEVYADFAAQEVGFMRPALHAAIELGIETFRMALDPALRVVTERFGNIAHALSPELSQESIDQLESSLKRTILAAALDTVITPEALRNEIYAIFTGYAAVPTGHPTVDLGKIRTMKVGQDNVDSEPETAQAR